MARIELESPANLHEFVYDEIKEFLAPDLIYDIRADPDGLHFEYTGEIHRLLGFRTITAAYFRLDYQIPRPKALLGHQHFQKLLEVIGSTRNLYPDGTFHSLFLSAAGSNSSVMQRIKEQICENTGLELAGDRGDLLIRIKRTQTGWAVLVRISPRPLSVRSWRECDMEGALNGPVAHVMMRLTDPNPGNSVINLMCGSGTILIERALYGPAERLIGIDNNIEALACSRHNLDNAKTGNLVELFLGDATKCPLRANSIDVLLADLPFGSLVGNHAQNLALYPALLREAARIAKRSAIFVLITHEITLMRRSLAGSSFWAVSREIAVPMRGLNPRIYVLRKNI